MRILLWRQLNLRKDSTPFSVNYIAAQRFTLIWFTIHNVHLNRRRTQHTNETTRSGNNVLGHTPTHTTTASFSVSMTTIPCVECSRWKEIPRRLFAIVTQSYIVLQAHLCAISNSAEGRASCEMWTILEEFALLPFENRSPLSESIQNHLVISWCLFWLTPSLIASIYLSQNYICCDNC